MTLSIDDPARRTPHAVAIPVDGAARVLYADAETDLPQLLDAVEAGPGPLILVLQDQARTLRGTVSARLLHRRARAADVAIAVVTADRATAARVTAAGIPSAPTVAEARRLVGPPVVEEEEDEFSRDPVAHPVTTVLPAPEEDAATLVLPPLSGATHDSGETVRLGVAGPQVLLAPLRGPDSPHRRRAPRRALLALAGVAALGAAIASWAFFLPQATIVITYGTGTIDRTYHILAGGGSTVPVYTTTLRLPGSLTVPATGTALVPYGRATGTVTFANPLNGVVLIPAGTVLTTANGTAFVTMTAAGVPSAVRSFTGTTNGQLAVQVQAVAPGPTGNVPAGTITALQGRLAGAVLVTNYATTSGGTMRTVYHITARDIAAAATVLRSRLRAAAVRDLDARAAQSPVRLVTGTAATPPVAVPVVVHGQLAARISLAAQVTLQYLHPQDLQRFASAHRAINLASRNLAVVPGTEHVAVSAHLAGMHFAIDAHVTARAAPVIDLTNLRGLLAGQTLSAARTLLAGSARFGGWQYTLTTNPDWFGRMPQLPSLIRITLQQRPS